jgi:hypothetical protein
MGRDPSLAAAAAAYPEYTIQSQHKDFTNCNLQSFLKAFSCRIIRRALTFEVCLRLRSTKCTSSFLATERSLYVCTYMNSNDSDTPGPVLILRGDPAFRPLETRQGCSSCSLSFCLSLCILRVYSVPSFSNPLS